MSTPQKKNSSLTTVLALLNNMLGGALLSFPILFKTKGIFSGVIVLVLSALISFLTCRIYVLHSKSDEKDVETTIKRVLGLQWQKYFSFITGFYLVLLNIITVDLIVDQLYSIVYFFFNANDSTNSIAPKDSLDFSRFSTQWLTLLLFVPLLGLCSLKNKNLMVKLSEYGSSAIFIYMGYVVIQFIISLANGSINLDEISWFSFDVAGLAGTCSLGFTVHTVVNTFMKENEKQENNQRDLGITYTLGMSIYLLVSVAGAFAISDKQCTNTLIDCFLTDWTILFVEVTYLFSRISGFPIMIEVARTRLLTLFYGELTPKRFTAFNILFMVAATIISIMSPKIPLSILMSIVGAVVCYFFIYLFPTKVHYGCLYPNRVKKQESLIQTSGSVISEGSPESSCNHNQDYVKRTPKIFRNLLHGTMNLIGVAIAIFGLYSSVKQIIEN